VQTNTESHSPQGLRNRRCSFSSNNLLPGGGSHKASPRLLPRLSNSTLYDATFCQCLPACVHLLLRSIVTERKTDGGLPVSEYACRAETPIPFAIAERFQNIFVSVFWPQCRRLDLQTADPGSLRTP